jgi:hypothetical protein
MDIAPIVVDEFADANEQLIPSEVVILPGNPQPPMTNLPEDWQLIDSLDNVDIFIREPDGFKLPECFEPVGKDAADIIIDISRAVPPGKKGLIPMTYRVTVNAADLAGDLGSAIASEVLSNPHGYLDEIFKFYVIQKEIHQGERAGWYTRLVDGVLSPQRAVDLGILDITGGNALSMTLSYYALDDAILEAYEQDGYLIVPDGSNDNTIVDPIWLNNWREGYEAGDNSMSGRAPEGGGSSGGGGGCATGAGAAFLLGLFCAAFAVRSGRSKRSSV